MKKITKYELNYLRFLTGGKLPDNLLRNVDLDSIKIEEGKIKFSVNVKMSTKAWKFISGKTNKTLNNYITDARSWYIHQ